MGSHDSRRDDATAANASEEIASNPTNADGHEDINTMPTDTDTDTETSTSPHTKRRWLGLALVAIGAVAIGGTSRMTWMTVHASDDKQGEVTRTLVGSTWAPSTDAIAIALIAACLATLVLKRTGRRILAAVSAVIGAASLWIPLNVLLTSPSTTRARNLLVNGQATQKKSDPQTLTEWAVITGVDVHKVAVILALIASVITIAGAIILFLWPGIDTVKGSKYDTTSARRDSLATDLENDRESGRVLWDAMDAGVDPTQDDAVDAARRRGLHN